MVKDEKTIWVVEVAEVTGREEEKNYGETWGAEKGPGEEGQGGRRKQQKTLVVEAQEIPAWEAGRKISDWSADSQPWRKEKEVEVNKGNEQRF